MFFSNDSTCNFNFIGKTVPFLSTDVIVVALFCYSSAFFSQEGVIFFFSFAHFLNKIVKPKSEAPFSKLLVLLYLLYISAIRHSKLRNFQKYITSKK